MRPILLASVALLTLTACEKSSADSPRDKQAERAATAANAVIFEKNSEIDNIQRRLKLTSNPGQIGFVLLLNQAGQPIMYTSVKGKITSGGKRLTKPYRIVDPNYCGSGACGLAVDSPSDEGTYGHSGEYVYFWTVDGQYVQWNGGYLYSDKPFRTNVQPLVIEVASPK